MRHGKVCFQHPERSFYNQVIEGKLVGRKPETKAREIYDALGYKYQPCIRKSVLPEKQYRETDNTDNVEITS